MGFRGFKGSNGDKGFTITTNTFKSCSLGWIQIGAQCYGVFNDTLYIVSFYLNYFKATSLYEYILKCVCM